MKIKSLLFAAVMGICVFGLAGCGQEERLVEEPPEEVLRPESADTGTADEAEIVGAYDGSVRKGVVTAKIGLNDNTDYTIDMYNNAAVDTILGYLSESEMRFPTYTYEEEDGYVAQNIRGNYTRDDETEVSEIHAGELYLFSDGQLRLYFKDVAQAGITATPIGYFSGVDNITELVQTAYEENKDDSWNVDVYFLITKKEEGTEEADKPQVSQIQEKESEIQMIYAQIGENILEISPENNSSAEALVKLLEESDITVDMREYGGFEKVGSLGSTLPTNDESITTEAGDVILYQGNQITIYYDKNTWNFTRLGRVQGISARDLKDILGDGDVTVTFSLKK
ncbi:MAG: hypothetical protein K2K56_12885 [Lachnospiraceae bacterium]|nr:hypothetical protein [Lachnospiraceae bacterium]